MITSFAGYRADIGSRRPADWSENISSIGHLQSHIGSWFNDTSGGIFALILEQADCWSIAWVVRKKYSSVASIVTFVGGGYGQLR
jgi:hypothetical protein